MQEQYNHKDHFRAEGDVIKSPSASEISLRDSLIKLLRDSGIEVIDDVEEGQQILDLFNRDNDKNVRLSSLKNKGKSTVIRNSDHRSPEISSSAVSSSTNSSHAGTPKVSKKTFAKLRDSSQIAKQEIKKYLNGDRIIPIYKDSKNDSDTFRGLQKVFGMIYKGNSRYALYNTEFGRIVFRLGTHNAEGRNFTIDGIDKNISVYVAKSEHPEHDTPVDYVEYRYSAENWNIHKKEIVDAIVRGVSHILKEGRFIDESGYADEIKHTAKPMRVEQGLVYGFTVNGKVYINPSIATAETPIHEYTHLWSEVLRKGNPEEWKNVVGLMKQETVIWDDVKKNYPHLDSDDDIADEVLATYSGRQGAKKLRALRDGIVDSEDTVDNKRVALSSLERFKQLLSRIWKDITDILHIHFTSAEEVADKVMSDLLNGVNPKVQSQIAKERAEIECRAKDDGTWMKSPNGKKSNLSEDQWVTVRTRQFKDWFGDWEKDPEEASQAVDENGEPKVFYHNTDNDFTVFDANKNGTHTDAGWLGDGFYFYGDENEGNGYGHKKMEVFLNARNLYYASSEENEKLAEANNRDKSIAFRNEIEDDGYDAVYYNGDLRQEAVVFYPEQIKSATDNIGMFNAANPDIRYQKNADNAIGILTEMKYRDGKNKSQSIAMGPLQPRLTPLYHAMEYSFTHDGVWMLPTKRQHPVSSSPFVDLMLVLKSNHDASILSPKQKGEKPQLEQSLPNSKKIYFDALALARQVGDAEGFRVERYFKPMKSQYDPKSDKVRYTMIPTKDLANMPSTLGAVRANDLYRAVVSAIGGQERLERQDRLPLLTDDASKHEFLVRDIAAGVLMSRQGLPAVFSKEVQDNIAYYEREIKENPSFEASLMKDVDSTIKALDMSIKGEHIDYATLRRPRPNHIDQRSYSIVQGLAKFSNSESREVIVIKDTVAGKADVILPQGASMKVWNEAPGLHKDDLTKALEKDGITKVSYYNSGGSLRLMQPNDYFRGKEVLLANYSKQSLNTKKPFDLSTAIRRTHDKVIEKFRCIKDDDGKYVFFLKPEGEKSFSVYPSKEQRDRFFKAAKEEKSDREKIRYDICQETYRYAKEHPEAKREVIMPLLTEDIDLSKIRDVSLKREESSHRVFIEAKINGEVKRQPVTPQQWERLWLADDMQAYKNNLAANIFAPYIKEEVSKDEMENSNGPELSNGSERESTDESEEEEEVHRPALHL